MKKGNKSFSHSNTMIYYRNSKNCNTIFSDLGHDSSIYAIENCNLKLPNEAMKKIIYKMDNFAINIYQLK